MKNNGNIQKGHKLREIIVYCTVEDQHYMEELWLKAIPICICSLYMQSCDQIARGDKSRCCFYKDVVVAIKH